MSASALASTPAPTSSAATLPDVVPPPFAAISHTVWPPVESDAPLVVEVWGRSYRFDAGPLPSRIESQGEPLFADAPRFRLGTSDAPGDRRTLVWSRPSVTSSTDRVLTLTTDAEAGRSTVRATTTIEYDGMIRVDLAISLPETSRLTQFAYEIALAPGVARWFNRHVRYDYESMNIDKVGLEGSAGRVPAGTMEVEYTPTLLLGNRRIGLEWWSDENIDWRPGTSVPIRVSHAGDRTTLTVEPVARAGDRGETWRHTFALFPLPLRATPPDWRAKRFVSWSVAREFRQEGFEYFWIAFPKHFQARHFGLPAAFSNEEQRALRERLDRRNVGYIPYGKLTSSPNYHPRTLANADRWAANDQRFTGPSPGEAKFMQRNHGWKKGNWYSYAVCTGAEDYLEWILAENLSALEEESLDGLYFDFGSVSRMCESDPRIEDRGRQQSWHYFELREFYKALYERSRAIAPDSLLTAHTNGQPRAINAFLHYNFIGEALNVVFRGGRSWGAVRKRPEDYDPDYLGLRPDFMLAQLNPPVGGVTSILPEIRFAHDPKRPERLRSYQRAFLAQFLREDVHFWFANSDQDELVRVMRALDVLGPLDDAIVHPYWSNREAIRRDPRIDVTAYEKADALLAVVANLTDEDIHTSLAVDPDLLGKPITTWIELEGQPETKRPLTPKTRLRIPARDFRIVLFE